MAEKRIPYLKVGHLVRFDTQEIAQWCINDRVGEFRTERFRGPGQHCEQRRLPLRGGVKPAEQPVVLATWAVDPYLVVAGHLVVYRLPEAAA